MTRSLLIALAATFLSNVAYAGQASEAVRFFYSPVTSESDPKYRDRFTDPARAKFDEADASATPDEVGCIDFVLAVDAQDLDDAEVSRTLQLDEVVKGDEATVTASFNLFPGEDESRREIIWTVKKVAGVWKIADIASEQNDWRLSEFDCTGE